MNNIQKANICVILLITLVSIYFTIYIGKFTPKGYELAVNGIVVTRAILFGVTAYLIVELLKVFRTK